MPLPYKYQSISHVLFNFMKYIALKTNIEENKKIKLEHKDMQWNVVVDNLRLYLDPCCCCCEIASDPSQHRIPHDYVLLVQSSDMTLSVPFIFSTFAQNGKRPRGNLRRISIEGNYQGVIVMFHEKQMSTLLHVVLPSLWSDYQAWKEGVCQRLHNLSRPATAVEITEYIGVYKSLSQNSDNGICANEMASTRLQVLERFITLSSIMSMRRKACEWNLCKVSTSLREVEISLRQANTTTFPGQRYSSFECLSYDKPHVGDDVDQEGVMHNYQQDELLRVLVEWRRPIFDNEFMLIRDLVLEPLNVTDLRIPIVATKESHSAGNHEHSGRKLSSCLCEACKEDFAEISLSDLYPIQQGSLQSSLHAMIGYAGFQLLLAKNPPLPRDNKSGLRCGGACGSCDNSEEPKRYQLEAALGASNFRIEWNSWASNGDVDWLKTISGDELDFLSENMLSLSTVHPVIVDSKESSLINGKNEDMIFHFLVDYKKGSDGATAYRINSRALVLNVLLAKQALAVVDQFLLSLRCQATTEGNASYDDLFHDYFQFYEEAVDILSPAAGEMFKIDSVMRGQQREEVESSEISHPHSDELVLSNRLLSAFLKFDELDLLFPQLLPFQLPTFFQISHECKSIPAFLSRLSCELVALSGEGAEEFTFVSLPLQVSAGKVLFQQPHPDKKYDFYNWSDCNAVARTSFVTHADVPTVNPANLCNRRDIVSGGLRGLFLDCFRGRYSCSVSDRRKNDFRRAQCEELMEGAFGSHRSQRLSLHILNTKIKERYDLKCDTETESSGIRKYIPVLVVPVFAAQARLTATDFDEEVGTSAWYGKYQGTHEECPVKSCVSRNRNTRNPIFKNNDPCHHDDCALNFLIDGGQTNFLRSRSRDDDIHMEVEIRLYDALLNDSSQASSNELIAQDAFYFPSFKNE